MNLVRWSPFHDMEGFFDRYNRPPDDNLLALCYRSGLDYLDKILRSCEGSCGLSHLANRLSHLSASRI